MKKLNNKGFTLMEMLIVVAIIAVLVAIAIPVMTSALEKSRESADAANIRSCYAEVMTTVLAGDVEASDNGVYKITKSGSDVTGTVTLTQKQKGWQNKSITNIAGENISAFSGVASGKTVVISYTDADGLITFDIP